MHNEHHALIHEFPEHRERIHILKVSDERFRAMFDRYHEVDREIHRTELDITPTTDEVVEQLKVERVQLKDELYAMLRAER